MRKNKALITPLGLVGITIFSGVFLMSSYSFATDNTDVVDEINITIPVSCTLTGTNLLHTDTIQNNQYKTDIGSATIKATCNDTNGLAVYAIGYTNETDGNNKMHSSTLDSSYDIVTGKYVSGTTTNSVWSMKLTPVSGTYAPTIRNDATYNYTNYEIVPSDYTKVAYRTTATDTGTGSTGANFTTDYAVYASATQPAGTYTGKVKFTLVHPSDHVTPVVCNENATTIAEAKCLQDFAHVSEANRNSIIASMTPEQQYTLKDSRDGKTYAIAKYQVGNSGNYDVWMTKNLDLDLDAGTTYTNEDTDIGYNTTTNSYETAAWSPIRSTYQPTSTHTHEWCTGGTWNSQYGYCELNDTPESYDPGNLYWNATESDYSDWDAYYNSCDYSNPTPVCDQALNPISTYVSSTSSTPQYHLGNYYNWAAALATNDSSQFNDSELVEQSICPAGWTLPRIGDSEDFFYSLWNQYGFSESSINGSNKLWTSPLYFAAGGYFNGNLFDVGYLGYFWSPVPEGSDYAWNGYFYVDGFVGPSVESGRYFGDSVRCVARPVVSSGSGGGGGGPGGPGN